MKAQEKQQMRMTDWVAEIDRFAENYGKGVLKDAGEISHSEAIEKATKEYKRAYLKNIKLLEKRQPEKLGRIKAS